MQRETVPSAGRYARRGRVCRACQQRGEQQRGESQRGKLQCGKLQCGKLQCGKLQCGKLQKRCLCSWVVRPLGSVMIAVSGPLKVIVTGATLSLTRVAGLYAPLIDWPLA